jgi:hypothetical protein
MFHTFQMYVASVLSVYIYMLQSYVVNVSFVSSVYCNKCFMLQVFHEPIPAPRSDPHVREGSEAGAGASVEHKAVSMGVVAGAEHEAAFKGRQ